MNDDNWTQNHHDAQAWLAQNLGREYAMGDLVESLADLLLRVRTEAHPTEMERVLETAKDIVAAEDLGSLSRLHA